MDLMMLNDWVIQLELKFDINKCKVRHIRKTNCNYTYTVIGSKFVITSWKFCEYFSINISSCSVALRKENQIEKKVEYITSYATLQMSCVLHPQCYAQFFLLISERKQLNPNKYRERCQRYGWLQNKKRLNKFTLQKETTDDRIVNKIKS